MGESFVKIDKYEHYMEQISQIVKTGETRPKGFTPVKSIEKLH